MLSQRLTTYPSYISNTLKQIESSHLQQSLFPPYQTDFYQGPSSPEHNSAIKKIMIVITMSTIVISGVVLHAYKYWKGPSDAKFTFTWSLHINVSWKCVDTTTLQFYRSYKNLPLLNPKKI